MTLDELVALKGDEAIGRDIVMSAMSTPMKCIISNAGHDPEPIYDQIMENSDFNYGYDALANTYGDLIASGVIDPTKVVRTALQNAGSVAGLMLITETLIVEELEDKKAARLPGR